LVSFVITNIGLTQIISWSIPILMFLYPIGLPLILLSLFHKWFDKSPMVYRTTIGFVLIPAILDALASLPIKIDWISQLVGIYHAIIPFSRQGFGWVIPGIIGFIIGFIRYQSVK